MKTLSYEDWEKRIHSAFNGIGSAYHGEEFRKFIEKYEAAKWVDAAEWRPDGVNHPDFWRVDKKGEYTSDWDETVKWTYIILPKTETPEQKEQRAIAEAITAAIAHEKSQCSTSQIAEAAINTYKQIMAEGE